MNIKYRIVDRRLNKHRVPSPHFPFRRSRSGSEVDEEEQGFCFSSWVAARSNLIHVLMPPSPPRGSVCLLAENPEFHRGFAAWSLCCILKGKNFSGNTFPLTYGQCI